jgi:hypothetical protein
LTKLGVLISKDGEDCLGGFTGLKPGKEGMLGEVLLSLTVVCFQSSVENRGKVGMGGGHRRDSGHGVTGPWEKRGKEMVGDE